MILLVMGNGYTSNRRNSVWPLAEGRSGQEVEEGRTKTKASGGWQRASEVDDP